MTRSFGLKAGLLCLVMLTANVLLAGSVRYSVLYLGELLDNGNTVPRGLNRCGEVVGESGFVDGVETRGFVWIRGQGMHSLESLPNGDYSVASAVNKDGWIAGYSNTITAVRAVRWAPPDRRIRELPVPAGDTASEALAINNKGVMVGMVSGPEGVRAVLWGANGVLPLPGLPGSDYSEALAINDTGQIVGRSGKAGRAHAVLWNPSDGIRDLGTLPGDFTSIAWDINERDEIVGSSSGPRGMHAVLWEKDGSILDLGVLPGTSESWALAINAAGDVVGNSGKADENHPFVWTPRTGMIDLNQLIPPDSSITLTEARDINARGQVIAYGQPRDRGTGHSSMHHSNVALAYLLTPVDSRKARLNQGCRFEPKVHRSSNADTGRPPRLKQASN